MTQLHPQPAPSETPKPAPAIPKRPPKPRPSAPLPPLQETTAAVSPVGLEASGTSVELAFTEPVVAAPFLSDAPVISEPTGAPMYKLNPPPPAKLKYDVEAKRDGKQWYGTGMFQWEPSGEAYRITGEAGIPAVLFKITVLNFTSEGMLNENGIAPILYSEQPWRKAMTNTHFQRAKRKITFSASEAAYPYEGGEQDRATIMWQLASIGRGDAGQFSPGAAFDIVVAGARDAETWHIQVEGLEDISTPFANMKAWHLVRAPRPGSHDQKIEMWLAPAHEWYPVRLRYTYTNGDYLDMALTDLTMQAPNTTSSNQ